MSTIQKLMNFFVQIEPETSRGTPVLVVFCNCAPGESPHLAKTLVEERLAACVNVIRGVTSYYEWQGEFEEEEEHTLVIKTTTARYLAMKERLLAAHSYDNPEVIALQTGDVARAYHDWVNEQTEEV